MSDYITKHYPTRKNISGIYEIYCSTNDKRYIGSSECLRHRRNDHRSYLRRGIHPNIHLQRAWSLYGENAFEFRVLEFCSPDVLLEREQHFIDTLNPEFNISRDVKHTTKGLKKPESARLSMIAKLTGKPKSVEHRQHISEAHKGKIPSDKTRSSISETLKAQARLGQHKGNYKLIQDDFAEILSLHQMGWTQGAIGIWFNVDRTTIGRVIRKYNK